MSFDAVIVPGGGLDTEGRPAPWVIPRLDAALEQAGQLPIILLSAGTTHKALVLDADGRPIYESVAAARYLMGKGCAASRILLDTWSLDTIGNALFARMMHCEPARLRTLLVITSNFHMPRSRAIFDWIFSVPPSEVTFELNYLTVPDEGMDPTALEERIEKEQKSLATLKANTQRFTSLEAVHRFVFFEHAAYAFGASGAVRAPGKWLGSY